MLWLGLSLEEPPTHFAQSLHQLHQNLNTWSGMHVTMPSLQKYSSRHDLLKYVSVMTDFVGVGVVYALQQSCQCIYVGLGRT